MTNLKGFADQLQGDVISDMADSYFGARKNLDEMLDAFYCMVEELLPVAREVTQALSNIHALLLDDETVRDFYIYIGAEPSCMPSVKEGIKPQSAKTPFALTARKRFFLRVFNAYCELQQVADEYINGRYYTVPGEFGRKRLTLHYLRLRALADYINGQVKRVNEDMSTTSILRHVKGMDPDRERQERIMGDICLMDGCELDRDMCFTPIQFDIFGFPIIQDLPQPEMVKNDIRKFCYELHAKRKEDVAEAISSLSI